MNTTIFRRLFICALIWQLIVVPVWAQSAGTPHLDVPLLAQYDDNETSEPETPEVAEPLPTIPGTFGGGRIIKIGGYRQMFTSITADSLTAIYQPFGARKDTIAMDQVAKIELDKGSYALEYGAGWFLSGLFASALAGGPNTNGLTEEEKDDVEQIWEYVKWGIIGGGTLIGIAVGSGKKKHETLFTNPRFAPKVDLKPQPTVGSEKADLTQPTVGSEPKTITTSTPTNFTSSTQTHAGHVGIFGGIAIPAGDFADELGGGASTGFGLEVEYTFPFSKRVPRPTIFSVTTLGLFINGMDVSALENELDVNANAGSYLNIPLMTGIKFRTPATPSMDFVGAFQVGLNYAKVPTLEAVSFEDDFEMEFDYDPAISFGFTAGGGFTFNRNLNVSIRYFGLGKPEFDSTVTIKSDGYDYDDTLKVKQPIAFWLLAVGMTF